jgi:hypothetical protein
MHKEPILSIVVPMAGNVSNAWLNELLKIRGNSEAFAVIGPGYRRLKTPPYAISRLPLCETGSIPDFFYGEGKIAAEGASRTLIKKCGEIKFSGRLSRGVLSRIWGGGCSSEEYGARDRERLI